MKVFSLLLFAVLTSCGGHLAQLPCDEDDASVVCLSSRHGTFVTRQANAPELGKLLAGEPPSRPHFSWSDLDASTLPE